MDYNLNQVHLYRSLQLGLTDYSAITNVVTFLPNSLSAEFTAQTTDDSRNELRENYFVNIRSVGGPALVGEDAQARVDIIDNDGANYCLFLLYFSVHILYSTVY